MNEMSVVANFSANLSVFLLEHCRHVPNLAWGGRIIGVTFRELPCLTDWSDGGHRGRDRDCPHLETVRSE